MKHFLKYFVFVAVTLLFTVSVFAQNSPPPKNSELQRWFCLKPTLIDGHESSLSVKDGVVIDSKKPTYVVVKISFEGGTAGENPTAEKSAITTGNSTLDNHIFSSSTGLDKLVKDFGFEGGVEGGNPTNTFPVKWKDFVSEERAHFWYGMQESDPVPAAGNGSLGSQQQGTFAFDKAKGATDCEFINWDPFGYVFDAVTHGPIKGVYVRLLTSATENGTYTPVPVGIGTGKVPANPALTNSDGSYKFYVSPGFYKLELLGDAAQSSKKYIIEKDINNVKPGYAEFGYEQLYIAEKPEVIHELAGKVERRDIAIKTIGAPAPLLTDGPQLKEIIVNRSIQNGESKIRVSGRALFIPIDLVAVYKDINNIVLEEKRFSLVHGHNYVPQNSGDERNFDIWMDAQTKDQKGTLAEVKTVSKYTTKSFSYHVDPMPSFLDGIANDKTGKPIIDGFVRVYPIGSDQSAFKTTTDKNGHFTVNSDQLPPLPYSLLYTTVTGDEIKVTTTEYLKQNAAYHKENLINPYSVKSTEPNPSTAQTKTNGNTSGSTSTRVQPTIVQGGGITSFGMQGIIMIVMTLVILVMIGVGAFVVMRSKQQQQIPPQM
ncbi:MAG: hypothetical protein V1922_04960 [bacterium]